MRNWSDFLETLRQQAQRIPGLSYLSSTQFYFRPLVMIFILGIVCGLLGVLVNLRCAEFSAEALVHSIFPGIVAGSVYFGINAIIPFAALAAVAVCIVLTINMYYNHGSASEAGTAIVLVSFFSAGITLSLRKGDKSGQLESLMFGRLLQVTDQRLLQAVIACIVALIIIAIVWKHEIFYAFDPVGARASGMSAFFLDLMLNIAIAGVVVAASTAIGTLLVIGYLTIPGAAARLVANRSAKMVLMSVFFSVVGGLLGLYVMRIKFSHPVSPQAAVALCMLGIYGIALILHYAKQSLSKVRKAL